MDDCEAWLDIINESESIRIKCELNNGHRLPHRKIFQRDKGDISISWYDKYEEISYE